MKKSRRLNKSHEQLQATWSSELLVYDTFYTNGLPDLAKEKEIIGGGNLADSAASHLSSAIELMTADYGSREFQLVIPILKQAIIVAEEALRTKNFGVKDELGGKSTSYETLFYAHFLLENESANHYLIDAINYNVKFYSRTSDDEMKIETLMPLYWYNSDFQEINRLYCEIFNCTNNANINANAIKAKRWYVVYLAARYEQNESDVYNIVQDGIKLWYDRGKDWSVFPTYKMYNIERVFWSYLFGKYIACNKSLISILHDMRGF